MELTPEDKKLLDLAVQQLWRKGAHSPDEAAIGHNFTQLVAKILKDEPKKEDGRVGK